MLKINQCNKHIRRLIVAISHHWKLVWKKEHTRFSGWETFILLILVVRMKVYYQPCTQRVCVMSSLFRSLSF